VIVFSSVMYFVERGQYFYCSQSSFDSGLCDTPVNRTEGMGLDECGQWANDEANVLQDKNLRCCFGEAWYAYPPTDVNGDQCADKSKYESIPATFWWCVVTMTTVGYGDVTPLTTWGKVVAMVTMIGGILILALPITVIGSNFNIEYENSENKKKQKQDLADEDGKGEVVKASTDSAEAKRVGGLPVTTSTTTLRNSLDQQAQLLRSVEELLLKQREHVIQKAEEMMVKHVRDIAKEVVEQHFAKGGAAPASVQEPAQPR